MLTLNQIKNLKFTIHYEIVEQGYTLRKLWEIEKHDGLTQDAFPEFCGDVLELLNNEQLLETEPS